MSLDRQKFNLDSSVLFLRANFFWPVRQTRLNKLAYHASDRFSYLVRRQIQIHLEFRFYIKQNPFIKRVD